MISLTRLVTILAGIVLLAAPANAQESSDSASPVDCYTPPDVTNASDIVEACSYSLSVPDISLGDELNGLLNRSYAYGLLEDWNAALADADRAIALAPEYDWSYWRRARIALMAGDAEQAYKDFDAGISTIANPPAGYFMGRGIASVLLGNDRAAISDFDHYLQIDQDSLDARVLRAQALERRGGYELALIDLDAAVNAHGAVGLPYLARADTYFRIGECGFAEADYQRAAAFAETAEAATARLAALRDEAGQANCLIGFTAFIEHSFQLSGQWRKVAGTQQCAEQLAIETNHYPDISIAPNGFWAAPDDPRTIRGQIEERRDGSILVYALSDGRREDYFEIRLDDFSGDIEITSVDYDPNLPTQMCRYSQDPN